MYFLLSHTLHCLFYSFSIDSYDYYIQQAVHYADVHPHDFVWIFLDDADISRDASTLSEIVIDRMYTGLPLPSNVFALASSVLLPPVTEPHLPSTSGWKPLIPNVLPCIQDSLWIMPQRHLDDFVSGVEGMVIEKLGLRSLNYYRSSEGQLASCPTTVWTSPSQLSSRQQSKSSTVDNSSPPFFLFEEAIGDVVKLSRRRRESTSSTSSSSHLDLSIQSNSSHIVGPQCGGKQPSGRHHLPLTHIIEYINDLLIDFYQTTVLLHAVTSKQQNVSTTSPPQQRYPVSQHMSSFNSSASEADPSVVKSITLPPPPTIAHTHTRISISMSEKKRDDNRPPHESLTRSSSNSTKQTSNSAVPKVLDGRRHIKRTGLRINFGFYVDDEEGEEQEPDEGTDIDADDEITASTSDDNEVDNEDCTDKIGSKDLSWDTREISNTFDEDEDDHPYLSEDDQTEPAQLPKPNRPKQRGDESSFSGQVDSSLSRSSTNALPGSYAPPSPSAGRSLLFAAACGLFSKLIAASQDYMMKNQPITKPTSNHTVSHCINLFIVFLTRLPWDLDSSLNYNSLSTEATDYMLLTSQAFYVVATPEDPRFAASCNASASIAAPPSVLLVRPTSLQDRLTKAIVMSLASTYMSHLPLSSLQDSYLETLDSIVSDSVRALTTYCSHGSAVSQKSSNVITLSANEMVDDAVQWALFRATLSASAFSIRVQRYTRILLEHLRPSCSSSLTLSASVVTPLVPILSAVLARIPLLVVCSSLVSASNIISLLLHAINLATLQKRPTPPGTDTTPTSPRPCLLGSLLGSTPRCVLRYQCTPHSTSQDLLAALRRSLGRTTLLDPPLLVVEDCQVASVDVLRTLSLIIDWGIAHVVIFSTDQLNHYIAHKLSHVVLHPPEMKVDSNVSWAGGQSSASNGCLIEENVISSILRTTSSLFDPSISTKSLTSVANFSAASISLLITRVS